MRKLSRKKRWMVWFSMGAAVSLTGVIGTGCQKKEEAAAADRIDFSEYDFTDAAAVRLQSMHTGHSIWLDEAEDVEHICGFLSGVKGKDCGSAKGYYEGTYTVEVYETDWETEVFGIGFGDSPTFFFGENGEDPGYPNRYTLDGISIEEVTDFFGDYLPLNDEAEDGEALYTLCLEAAEAAGLSEAVRPAPSRRGFLWSLKMGPG